MEKIGTFILTHDREELFNEELKSLAEHTGQDWHDIFVQPTTMADYRYARRIQNTPTGQNIKLVLEPLPNGRDDFNHGKHMDLMARFVIAEGYTRLFSLDDDVTFYNDKLLAVPDLFDQFPNAGVIGPEWHWDQVARGQYKNANRIDRGMDEYPVLAPRNNIISFCCFLDSERYLKVGGAYPIEHDGDTGLNCRLKRHGYYPGMTNRFVATQPDKPPGGLQNHKREALMIRARDELVRMSGGDLYLTRPQFRSVKNRVPYATEDGQQVYNFKFSREVQAISDVGYRIDHDGNDVWNWRPKGFRRRKWETDYEHAVRYASLQTQEQAFRDWAEIQYAVMSFGADPVSHLSAVAQYAFDHNLEKVTIRTHEEMV